MTDVFLTGAGGFVGAHVLNGLLARGARVRALDRSERLQPRKGLEIVRGRLGDPSSYRDALRGADTVVHLAAATGKASADEHRRINRDGTVELLEASADSGVRRWLFVSTVAVKFADKRDYPYALAKQAAEEAVRRSGLRFAIVRPTIVAGPGSPVMRGLAKLAGLPVMPVFGDGRTPVQPIHVADLAELMRELLDRDAFEGEVLELGGPDVISIEQLLRALRARVRGRRGPVVHLPIAPLLPFLRLAERIAGAGPLPVTAGQLSTFRFDGTIAANPLHDRRREGLRGISEMIAESFDG